jgi:hypothetical protein
MEVSHPITSCNRLKKVTLHDYCFMMCLTNLIRSKTMEKVRRMVTRQGKRLMAWTRMRKGIVDIRRRVEVSRAANERYLEALAIVGDPSPSHRLLDPISKQVIVDGRTFRPLRPIAPEDSEIFRHILRGEFALQGLPQRIPSREAISRC